MEGLRVLLVDDEQDIVETVKYSLEMRGFEVDVAYDGTTALSMARSGAYALLVLDVMLPGKNGYEVSRLLKDEMARGEMPPLKILLITARKLDNELREDFVSTWSKADDCLYKPFDLEGLMERVNALLAPVEG
ncbi:MAG TPA: response regulator transcription factor [Candidatus Krumholzibacteria bacterium]|nr:response regulator transcription factor [Candidatus Krumholzibacteria bacterium]